MAATVRDLYEYRWSALNIDAKLLHRFATNHNWDEGPDLLVRCIRHPLCSLATALLIYWLGKPHYFRQYPKRSAVPDFERPGYDLLTAIERRVEAGEYEHAGLTFDPRRHAKTDWTTGAFAYPELVMKRALPAHMLIAVTKNGAVPFEIKEPKVVARKSATKRRRA